MRNWVLLAVALAGFGVVTGGPAGASTGARAIGTQPSKSAKMVCASEAQKDIARNLGNVKPTTVTPPTWSNSTYSCQYVYPNGTVSLSVKELKDASATKRYLKTLGDTLGRRPRKLNLGGGGFTARDGSVVVRKDFKVLDVDVSKLTGPLGAPPEDAPVVAVTIAATVLGCWSGA